MRDLSLSSRLPIYSNLLRLNTGLILFIIKGPFSDITSYHVAIEYTDGLIVARESESQQKQLDIRYRA